MRNSMKNRCSLAEGTKAIAITSILLAILSGCGHGRMDTDYNPPNNRQEGSLVWGTSTSAATTSTTKTTSTTATMNLTTTMEMTTLKSIKTTAMKNTSNESIQQTSITYSDVTPETTVEITDIEFPVEAIEETTETKTESILPITDQEFILLANVVSHEAGSSWITEYDRACIVAAIMTRVADSRFPNTIDEVVHQSGQMFDVPYYRVDYSTLPREEIDNAVYAYFNCKYEFGNFNSWSGDGTKNYFYYQ